MQDQRTTRSDKARRELGATFRPLSETLRDEIAWFQQYMPEWINNSSLRRLAPTPQK